MAGFDGIRGSSMGLVVDRRDLPEVGKPKPMAYESTMTLVTGQSIIESMGRAPKKDIKIGALVLYTRSTEYKEALAGLERFHELASGSWNQSTHDSGRTIAQMKTALRDVVESADAYIEKHGENTGKANRRGVMADLKQQALRELSYLDRMSENAGNFPPSVKLGESYAFARGGVDHFALVTTTRHDGQLVGKPVTLGSGMINTVSLATYRTSEGGTEVRVLKPLVNEKGASNGKDAFLGIDLKDLRSGQRNLASASVASLLGQPGMVPKPEIVLHDGKACLSMPLAEGEDLLGTRVVVFSQSMQENLTEWERTGDTASIEMLRAKKREDNVWISEGDAVKEFAVLSDVPSERTGNIQKSMLDLQVVDMLCGQVDRHQHNFFIRIEGTEVKLTGIDNDTAFGRFSDTVTNITTDGLGPRIKVPWPGLPPLMSIDMFNSLNALTPETLKTQLENSGLTDDEVGATLVRLAGLKEHASFLESKMCIVDDFTTWSGVDPRTNVRMNASDYMMASQFGSYVKQFGELDQELTSRGATRIPLKGDLHEL